MKAIRSRKALIAPADSALGSSIALALAAEGADLYLLGRRNEELAITAQAASGFGIEAVTIACDLTQPAEVSAAVTTILDRWCSLHILVNIARELHVEATHVMSAEHWEHMLSANLLGPVALVRSLLPTLALQDEAHILNVCSLFGLVATRKMAAFQTSQFGLVGFTAALRAEYIRKGFGMTALCPDLSASPDEIGRQAIRAIKKNNALQVSSGAGRLSWWTARLSPALGNWMLSSRRRPGFRRDVPQKTT